MTRHLSVPSQFSKRASDVMSGVRAAGRTKSAGWSALFSLLLLVALPRTALAHPGQPPAPHDIWSAWSWEPALLVSLVVTGCLYAFGTGVLWGRVGPGRCIEMWRFIAFGGGLLALFVALVSPLDALGQALFSAHMVQHLILMLVAAPLLVLGAPLVPWLWALPKPARKALGGWWKQAERVRMIWHGLSEPILVWFLYAAALWIWHLPTLYQAALTVQWIHDLEHVCFLGTALLLWWTLIQPNGHRRLSYGAGALFVFTTALHSGVFGALLAFAQTLLYPVYRLSVRAWGLTPLEDQQLAGLIMWIPPGVIYLLTALALLVIWFNTIEKKMQRREKRQTGTSRTDIRRPTIGA